METVEILIRIPKRDFDFIKDEFADGDMPDEKDLKETTYYAIASGTVLPAGHGRLIDADELFLDIQTDEQMRLGEHLAWVRERIEDTPTVIAADKGEE